MKLKELYIKLGELIENRPELENKDITMEIVSPFTEISSGESLCGDIEEIEIDFDTDKYFGGVTLRCN